MHRPLFEHHTRGGLVSYVFCDKRILTWQNLKQIMSLKLCDKMFSTVTSPFLDEFGHYVVTMIKFYPRSKDRQNRASGEPFYLLFCRFPYLSLWLCQPPETGWRTLFWGNRNMAKGGVANGKQWLRKLSWMWGENEHHSVLLSCSH